MEIYVNPLWPRGAHILTRIGYVIIVSGDPSSPVQRQVMTRNNDIVLSVEQISVKFQPKFLKFFQENDLKITSAKYCPFCTGLNVYTLSTYFWDTMFWFPLHWTHDMKIMSLWFQNDVVTSFWRNNDVIFRSCVRRVYIRVFDCLSLSAAHLLMFVKIFSILSVFLIYNDNNHSR